MKTILFLSDFWGKAKRAVKEIETELPKVQKENILKPIGTSGKMWTIQYKDLGNNWSVKHQLQRHNGESNNLTLLTYKINDIFRKSPDKIVEFLTATANKGYFISKLGKLANEQGIKVTFTVNELARLRMYIKENV